MAPTAPGIEVKRRAADSSQPLDDVSRAALFKKTSRVLFASQVAGSAGISVAVTVGGLIVKAMLGKDTFAGSASATLTLGGAVAGLLLSQTSQRRGRRTALLRGYLIALVGAGVTVLGAEQRLLWLFLLGILLFGVGQGTNLMARFAAADLALPDERGRAISLLLFGSTFGAVSAQLLVGPCERFAEWLGLWKYSGPFLFSAVLLAVAATNTYVRLRPDPLIAAGGVDPDAKGFKVPPVAEALRIIRRSPMAKLALSAMVIAQASMVGVMTMTPLHMRDHGHSDSLSGAVIALHVVGMFGLAPIVGRFSDRGRLPVILRGSLMLVGATLLSALAGYRTGMLFAGLFFLGLGWSGCMIAGSSLLVDSVPSEHRLKVQGSADLLMSLCGGIAGFGSGFVKRQWGYHVLSQMGMAATAILFVLALRQFRRNSAAATQVGVVS